MVVLSLVTLFAAAVIPCTGVFAAINKKPSEKKPPESPVKVVPNGNSCVDCHKALAGNLRSVVLEWEVSVHAKKGNKCNICHGGNPAIYDAKLSKSPEYNFVGRPEKKDITDFCGRGMCHATALHQFKKSPHFDSVLKMGDPNCVSCHGKHNIQRSSMNIISDKTCSDCHSVEYSREIIKSIFSIENDIIKLEENIDYLEKKKADVKDAYDRLKKTKTLFHQLVHVFSKEDIDFTQKIVALEIKSLNDDIVSKLNVVRRLDFIYVFTAVFSFATIFGLAFYVLRMLTKRK